MLPSSLRTRQARFSGRDVPRLVNSRPYQRLGVPTINKAGTNARLPPCPWKTGPPAVWNFQPLPDNGAPPVDGWPTQRYIGVGNEIYNYRFHRDIMKTKIPDIEKRQKIVDRSRSLFLMRGVSSLTMEEIASLQGISKKTLYRYFPNKDALASAAIEEKIAEVAGKMGEIARTKNLSFLEKIREILRTVSRQMAELGEGLVRDLYYNQPELWAKIDRYRQEHVFVIIEKLLREGAKSGLIRPDIDGRLVPALFVTTISSVMNPEQFVKMTVPPVEFFETVVKILFGGILTEKARREFFRREDAS